LSLESFLENFAVLSDAPNSIAQLRELILQLAVEGKLSAQDPSDEPASKLLQRIKTNKERIAKTGNGDKKAEAYKSDEPFTIPKSWEWVRLDQITNTIHYGYTASANELLTDVRLLRITDIQNGKVDWAAVPGCEIENHTVDGYKLTNNDILIARTGGTIGKSYLVENLDLVVVFASYLIRAIPSRFLFAKYLKIFFESDLYWKQLYERSMGTGQPNVNATSLKSLAVPLPPIEEQKRIVTKVNELMLICGEVEARQQAKRESRVRLNTAILAPLNKAASLTPEEFEQATTRLADSFNTLYDSVDTVKALRSTILQLAVQGKLVPQDMRDQASIDKPTSRLKADDFLFRSPDSWQWTRFGEVAEIVSGVTKGRKLHGRKTESYPYLRVANVQRWFLDLRVIKEIEIFEGEIEKYRLQQDDLLITEGGDWDKVGRTAIWGNQIENCVHQNHVFRARLSEHDLLPFWAMMFLNSAIGRRYFEAASKQTTNLASINMRQLRACPLPIPPLAEQKRIVAKVNQLMSLCDELEAKLRQSEADSEKLMNVAVKHVLDCVRNTSKSAEGSIRLSRCR
jgi:type I restriction enzyme, S subunit